MNHEYKRATKRLDAITARVFQVLKVGHILLFWVFYKNVIKKTFRPRTESIRHLFIIAIINKHNKKFN
jgi:hypothetical protein